jgi:hypothetical protein
MGLLDSIKQGAEDLLGLGTTDATPAPAAPPPAAPPPDAPPPDAPAPAPEQAQAAAQAHAGELTAAQVQLAGELAQNPKEPIPAANGRYEYEAALDYLSQVDKFDDTKYDACRCGANSTVGALLVRGQDGLKDGLDKLAASAKYKWGPQWDQLRAAVKTVEGEIAGGSSPSPYDLSVLADRMYAAYASKDARGQPVTTGLNDDQLDKLQSDCGLAPKCDKSVTAYNVDIHPDDQGNLPAGDQTNIDKARENAVNDLYARLSPGGTATVHDSATQGGGEDHYVLVGKKPDGTIFCYDSGAEAGKNYYEGPAAVAHMKDEVDVDNQFTSDGGERQQFFLVAHMHGRGAAD